MSGFLTVAEVAADLRVSPRTILRWVEAGDLVALRLPGGRLRIPETALAAWTTERMTTAATRTLTAADAAP